MAQWLEACAALLSLVLHSRTGQFATVYNSSFKGSFGLRRYWHTGGMCIYTNTDTHIHVHTHITLLIKKKKRNIESYILFIQSSPTLLTNFRTVYHSQEIDLNVIHQSDLDGQFDYVCVYSSVQFHHIRICVCNATVKINIIQQHKGLCCSRLIAHNSNSLSWSLIPTNN